MDSYLTLDVSGGPVSFTMDSGLTMDSDFTLDAPGALGLIFNLILELFEVSRFAGTIVLYWNQIPGAFSYTVQNNQHDLITNIAAGPIIVTGLEVGVSYMFKVVANTAGGGIQSQQIPFEFGATEIGEVESLPWLNPGSFT